MEEISLTWSIRNIPNYCQVSADSVPRLLKGAVGAAQESGVETGTVLPVLSNLFLVKFAPVRSLEVPSTVTFINTGHSQPCSHPKDAKVCVFEPPAHLPVGELRDA